jgi:hypothetical protein
MQLSPELLRDRRVVIGGGALLALALGLVLAMALGGRKSHEPPPAAQGGLVVETGRDDDAKLDPKRPLRCFVNGQFVGEMPLEQCAQKNGVATGALDVGLDPSGALAASGGASTDITPLPPQPVTPVTPAPATPVEPAPPAAAPTQTAALAGPCMRYGAGAWSTLSPDMTLNACVQALYAGHCEKGSNASYGRWVDQTLRLTRGRVEISQDNRNFRTLVEQGPACATPAIG